MILSQFVWAFDYIGTRLGQRPLDETEREYITRSSQVDLTHWFTRYAYVIAYLQFKWIL